MTLSELIEDVRSRLDEDTAGFWTDAEITRWLNEGNKRVAYLLGNLEAIDLQSTVVAQASYDLPTDILKMARVQYNSQPLRVITFKELNTHESLGSPTTSESGTPEYCYLWADKIYLYPAPSAVVVDGLSIYYTKQPSTLTDSTDTPDHPDYLHYLLPLYAWYLGYTKDMCRQEAQTAYGMFREGIEDALEYAMQPQDMEYGQLYYEEN